MKSLSTFTFKAILLAGFFSIQSFIALAEDTSKKYATMRVYETSANTSLLKGSKIVIVYENGQSEEIKLEGMRMGNSSDNIKIINEKINALSVKGYELISVTGMGNDVNIMTYTFRLR